MVVAGERAGLARVRGAVRDALPLLEAAAELGIEIEAVDVNGPGDLVVRPSAEAIALRVGSDPRGALLDWLELSASGLIDRFGAREVDLRFGGSAVLRHMQPEPGGGEDGPT